MAYNIIAHLVCSRAQKGVCSHMKNLGWDENSLFETPPPTRWFSNGLDNW